MFGERLAAHIKLGTWPVLPIFDALQTYGKIPPMEMYEIFNMGLGMVLAVSPEKVGAVKAELAKVDEEAFVIGEITKRDTDAVTFSK
jgi:phosphoribosylformylglycinamidine cyclo-ligase